MTYIENIELKYLCQVIKFEPFMPFDINKIATYLKEMIPNLELHPSYTVKSMPQYLDALKKNSKSGNRKNIESDSIEQGPSLEDINSVNVNGDHLLERRDMNQPVSEENVENQENLIEIVKNEENLMEIDDNHDSHGTNLVYETEEDHIDSDSMVDQSMFQRKNAETQKSDLFSNMNQEKKAKIIIDEHSELVRQFKTMVQEFQLKMMKMTELIEKKQHQLAGLSNAADQNE